MSGAGLEPAIFRPMSAGLESAPLSQFGHPLGDAPGWIRTNSAILDGRGLKPLAFNHSATGALR